MRRRVFSLGLFAGGLSAPMAVGMGLGNEAGVSISSLKRVQLWVPGRRIRPVSADFISAGRLKYRINLRRMVPQANEDRVFIRGFGKPNLTEQFRGATRVGDVRLMGKRIYVVPDRRLEMDYHGIHIANRGTSFLIGGLLEDAPAADRIPSLHDIPLIGSLFRSQRSDTGQRSLLILVTPSVVKVN